MEDSGSSRDNYFMRNALNISLRGIGNTFPNPSVGTIIVKDNKIIGILFNRWMETSPDSPYIIDEVDNDTSHENLHTLVKINSEGVSNQWTGSHTVFNEIDKKNKEKNPYHSIRYI